MGNLKIRVILASLIALIFLNGCGQIGDRVEDGPQGTLIQYLDASYRFDLEEAYRHISSKDKAVRSFTEYRRRREMLRETLAGTFAGKFSYQVQTVDAQDSVAEVTVKIQASDFLGRLGDFASTAFVSILGMWDGRSFDSAPVKKYKTGKMLMAASAKKFKLLKESDGWKVFLGWKTEKKAKRVFLKREKA